MLRPDRFILLKISLFGMVPSEDGVYWLHFYAGKDSLTDVIIIRPENKGAEVLFYNMHPTTIGKKTYMNLRPYVPDQFATAGAINEESGYSIVK